MSEHLRAHRVQPSPEAAPVRTISMWQRGKSFNSQNQLGVSQDDRSRMSMIEMIAAPEAGRSLDPGVRDFMERRIGHSFGDVRIYDDHRSAETASNLGADAYTLGSDIFFDSGKFSPDTASGRRLLAHELTHTVQQKLSSHTVSQILPYQIQENIHTERQANRIAQSIDLPTFTNLPIQPAAPGIQRQQKSTTPSTDTSTAEQQNVLTSEGESFWVRPRSIPSDAEPIYDDAETGEVIGYRTGGSVRKTYDLEGKLVDIYEPPLESPLIDPIDLIVGGLVGFFRTASRSAAGVAAKEVGAAATSAGARSMLQLVSSRALTAMRAIFRKLKFTGALNFTETAASRLAIPGRRVPQHILKLAIQFGKRTPDPDGVAGVFRYVIKMSKGKLDKAGKWIYRDYELEVVVREADQTVLHFLYR